MNIVITKLVNNGNGGQGLVELRNEEGDVVHTQKFSGKIELGEYSNYVNLVDGNYTATFTPLNGSEFTGYFIGPRKDHG